jgi:hypothetical protein
MYYEIHSGKQKKVVQRLTPLYFFQGALLIQSLSSFDMIIQTM